MPAGSIRVPMLRWHLARAAASVWAGRHWSAEDALSAHLAEAYYGHGFFGLGAAARGYFGLLASELDRVQLAHLVVLPKAPTRLDPWCQREPNRAAASRLVELPVGRPPGLLPVPPGACPQLARSSTRF